MSAETIPNAKYRCPTISMYLTQLLRLLYPVRSGVSSASQSLITQYGGLRQSHLPASLE